MLTSMRLLVLAVLVPAFALAQPARDMAAVCSSKPTGDDLVACGHHYLDAYNKAPTAADADRQLYDAGVMFSEGAAISAAIQTFALLRKSFPKSRYAPHALARTGQLYARVMMLDKAADALEEYASKYAGEKDAYYALSDAVYYRRALGDDERVIQQTKFFVKMFGAKKLNEAAAAMFALTSVYEKRGDPETTIKHLQEYVRVYGDKGGRSNFVIAFAKIGELQWQRSCPVRQIDGECVRIKRGTPVCEGARVAVERVKRDPRLVKEALASFATAIRKYEVERIDDPAARYYYARALVVRTDAEAEAAPMPAAPRGAKLAAWTSEQVVARGKLNTKYEAVIAAKDFAGTIAAAARIARLSDEVASAIVSTAAQPADCKALADTAAPFRENAIRGYAVCLAKASELGFFEDNARSCEAALARLAPDEFPPFRELVGQPPTPTPVLVVSGP